MSALVFGYFRLFCMAFFFTNVNCEYVVVAKNSSISVQKEFYDAACSLKCIQEKYVDAAIKSNLLRDCYNLCQSATITKNLNSFQFETEVYAKLICRHDTSIAVDLNAIKNQTHISYIIDRNRRVIEYETNGPKFIYLVEVFSYTDKNSFHKIYLSDYAFLDITGLEPSSKYKLSIAAITSDYQYSLIDGETYFETLPTNYQPMNITESKVINITENADSGNMVNLGIIWYPAEDKVCNYTLSTYYSAGKQEDMLQREYHINRIDQIYHYETDVKLDEIYNYGVIATNRDDKHLESSLQWFKYYTPVCENWSKNVDECKPMPPNRITINTEVLSVNNNFYNNNILISWDKPKHNPSYYFVSIAMLDHSKRIFTKNVTGMETEVLFSNIEISSLFPTFQVEVKAYRAGFVSKGVGLTGTGSNTKLPTDKWKTTKIILIVFIVPTIIILSIALFLHIRDKMIRDKQRCQYFEDLEQRAQNDSSIINERYEMDEIQLCKLRFEYSLNENLEIDRMNIKLLEKLGEGAFGVVFKGLLSVDNTFKPVAVKMLKESSSKEVVKEFLREITVMNSVTSQISSHPNIVKLVGHCTKNLNDMLLITEYCSKGNLLEYMRLEWQKIWHLRQNTSININEKLNGDQFNRRIPYRNCTFTDNTAVTYMDQWSTNTPPSSSYIDTSCIHNDNSNVLNTTAQSNPNYCATDKRYYLNHNPTCKDELLNNISRFVDDVTSTKLSNENFTNDLNRPTLSIENISYNLCQLSECNDEQNGFVDTNQNADMSCLLTSEILLSYAKQIAAGMEFLATNKVVHRDLAARNVLVCDNNNVKIADFGLSRDVYQENIYKKFGDGKLPIKWLALESMTHQVYTVESDVWSYGILLYEIVTLGSTPYPSIDVNNLVRLLKTGYRMEKPRNCSDSLYDLMLSCWNIDPKERPKFHEIRIRLECIERDCNELRESAIDLDMQEKTVCHNALDDSSYLKPI